MAPPQATVPRARGPLIAAVVVAASGLFIGFKWKAVVARSEAAKIASSKEGVNYSVAPGRSGGGI